MKKNNSVLTSSIFLYEAILNRYLGTNFWAFARMILSLVAKWIIFQVIRIGYWLKKLSLDIGEEVIRVRWMSRKDNFSLFGKTISIVTISSLFLVAVERIVYLLVQLFYDIF